MGRLRLKTETKVNKVFANYSDEVRSKMYLVFARHF